MTASPGIALPALDPERLYRVALHESGHAIALLVLWPGQGFVASLGPTSASRISGSVSPIGGTSSLGKVKQWRRMGWFTRERLRLKGIYCYSGLVAQYHDYPLGAMPLEALDASFEDRVQLVAFAKACGRRRPLMHAPSARRAAQLIDREWGVVRALTEELLRCGVVSSKRARAIVEAAPHATNRRPAQW